MGCSSSKDSSAKYTVSDDNNERVTRTSPPGQKKSGPNLSQVSHIRPGSGRLPGASGPDSGSNNPSGGVSKYVPKKPALDPKDFRFVGCRSQVMVKAPGTINGQAFTIDDCQDCDLYVLDACAQVNIDDCKNCRIFIGPCTGSIFLRSSSNVQGAFVTRQLRLRDVTQARISLLCRTQPILESSTEVQLGCFSLNYAALPGQLKASKLDVVHNFWWWPYDFTPKEGGNNWTCLAPDQDTEQVLGGTLPEEVIKALGGTSKEGELVVTWGDRPDPPGDCYLFALFATEDAAHQYMNQAKHQGTVLTTNSVVCTDDVMDAMANQAGWPRGAERGLLVPGPVWGIELRCSADVAKTLGGAVHMLGGQHTANTEVGGKFRKLGLEGSG